jgi:hypothetical protein
MSSNNLAQGIEHSYADHQDLLIFALTGRTGSGCSTAASLLSKPFTRDESVQKNYEDPEYRKKKIVDDFCEKNWVPFSIITVSSLLITYLVEIKNPELSDFLTKSFSDINSETIEKIKSFLSSAAVDLNSLIDLINLKRGDFYSTDWKAKINTKDSITKLLPQKLSELRTLLGEHYNQFFKKLVIIFAYLGAQTMILLHSAICLAFRQELLE